MTKQVLTVTGMSCAHCTMTVEGAVGAVAGVKSVKADFRKGRVTVTCADEPGLMDKVKAAITQAGYTVAS